MPRTPTRVKVSLLAGLICLGISLIGPGWGREALASARGLDAPRAEFQGLPQPLLLAARPASPAFQTPPPRTGSDSSSSSLSLTRQLCTGGFLGPVLCYYVFGYPLSSLWLASLWPPGLLDILVVVALCYLGYRLYRRRKKGKAPDKVSAPRGFLRPENPGPPTLSVTNEAESGLAAIAAEPPGFDLQTFWEEARQLLLEVYAAWSHQELEGLNGRVKESLLDYLRMGLKIMSFREESSFLDDLTLEGITVTAAGVNDGREFITVCFRGWLLDYVVDKKSGKLLVGSMAYPSVFQEYWDLERLRGQDTWVIHDIREA